MEEMLWKDLVEEFLPPQVAQAPLPAYMVGTFTFLDSKGFSDFLYELGLNFIKRTVTHRKFENHENLPNGVVAGGVHPQPHHHHRTGGGPGHQGLLAPQSSFPPSLIFPFLLSCKMVSAGDHQN